MTYEKQVANLVKNAIEDSPHTLHEVSEHTGIALTTLKRKLSSGTALRVSEVYRIASLLGRSITDFIAEDASKAQSSTN